MYYFHGDKMIVSKLKIKNKDVLCHEKNVIYSNSMYPTTGYSSHINHEDQQEPSKILKDINELRQLSFKTQDCANCVFNTLIPCILPLIYVIFSPFSIFNVIFIIMLFLMPITYFNKFLKADKKFKLNFKSVFSSQKQLTRNDLLIYGLDDIYKKNKLACDDFILSLNNHNIDVKEIFERPKLLSQEEIKDIDSIKHYVNLVNSISLISNKKLENKCILNSL